MTRGTPLDLPASVRQRLLNHARATGEDFQTVLTRFGLERILYRIFESPHGPSFVLKGALLFVTWKESVERPTRDLDLLGRGEWTVDRAVEVFREICELDVKPDGLDFDASSVRAAVIREHATYRGVRVRLDAVLARARIPLQVDVGVGDVVTPAPEIRRFPTLLPFPAPKVLAYPAETVVAEKLESIVSLGLLNSRMKDYYDLWRLAGTLAFDGATLSEAVRRTFERRGTEVPKGVPPGLTDEFAEQPGRSAQWRAFAAAQGQEGVADLLPLLESLRGFLTAVLDAVAQERPFAGRWAPSSGWASGEEA